MPTLHLLRVFCSDDGSGGNSLGVFVNGAEVPSERRQAVAADLGLSETVLVDDAEQGEVRIFTPAVELDFAGHPAVGTAWLLESADVLRVAAGEVAVRRDGELVYVAARPEWGPPHKFAELASPDEVEALDGPPGGHDLLTTWSWIDEPTGLLRARAFLARLGIAEDEATGSAATKLCAQLGRPIDIRQGRSSRILARPGEDGFVEIGGRSVLDEVRDYALP
jgi:predicted PhzF superfamily epimerase YddE/YHI9